MQFWGFFCKTCIPCKTYYVTYDTLHLLKSNVSSISKMVTNASTCQKRSLSTEEVIECIYANNDSKSEKFSWDYLNLFRMGLLRSAYGWVGEAKRPPSLKSFTHILQWWNLVQLYLTYKISKKYINHVTQALRSADISFF